MQVHTRHFCLMHREKVFTQVWFSPNSCWIAFVGYLFVKNGTFAVRAPHTHTRTMNELLLCQRHGHVYALLHWENEWLSCRWLENKFEICVPFSYLVHADNEDGHRASWESSYRVLNKGFQRNCSALFHHLSTSWLVWEDPLLWDKWKI